MSVVRVRGVSRGLERNLRPGDIPLYINMSTAQATDANSVIGANVFAGGLYIRSGMTAARTDTTDTGVNLDAALSDIDVGDTIELDISNTVAFVLTIAAGVGVTLAGKVIVPVNGFGMFLLLKTGVATYTLTGL